MVFSDTLTDTQDGTATRGIEVQEKEVQKIKAYRNYVSKESAIKRCLLILAFKPFRS